MKSKIIIIFPSIILLLLLLTLYNKLATKDVTLNFYTHDSEIIDQIIDDFEKEHSNIKIEKKIIPPNTNRLEFITNALNNDDIQIDIIDTDIIWVYNLAKNNLITPLDNYFSNKELNDFLSSAINGNIIDNQIYGIPYRTDTGILYYRKDLLKKYNQNIPKTYDDLIKTYNHISSKEEIYGFGGSWQSYEGLTCNALELLWSFGGEINLSEEDINNHTIINTKDNEKAFKEIKNLIDKKITHPDILEFYSGDLREEFIKGNLLFMRDWPAGWNKIQNDELSILKDKVGISYLPLGIIHGNNSGTLGGWQLTIAKKSKNHSESANFIKFFTNYNNSKKLILENSYLPARKNLYFDSDIINTMPFIKRNIDLFNNSKHRPFIKEYPAFSKVLIENLTLYLKNEITLKFFLENTEQKLTDIIK